MNGHCGDLEEYQYDYDFGPKPVFKKTNKNTRKESELPFIIGFMLDMLFVFAEMLLFPFLVLWYFVTYDD